MPPGLRTRPENPILAPSRQDAKKPQGLIYSAHAREAGFAFAVSAQLTTFGFALLGALASLRDAWVLVLYFCPSVMLGVTQK
jgi:hypothetical protein